MLHYDIPTDRCGHLIVRCNIIRYYMGKMAAWPIFKTLYQDVLPNSQNQYRLLTGGIEQFRAISWYRVLPTGCIHLSTYANIAKEGSMWEGKLTCSMPAVWHSG